MVINCINVATVITCTIKGDWLVSLLFYMYHYFFTEHTSETTVEHLFYRLGIEKHQQEKHDNSKYDIVVVRELSSIESEKLDNELRTNYHDGHANGNKYGEWVEFDVK